MFWEKKTKNKKTYQFFMAELQGVGFRYYAVQKAKPARSEPAG